MFKMFRQESHNLQINTSILEVLALLIIQSLQADVNQAAVKKKKKVKKNLTISSSSIFLPTKDPPAPPMLFLLACETKVCEFTGSHTVYKVGAK